MVDRNQVDMALEILDQFTQRPRMFRLVIDAAEQAVLESDPAVRLLLVILERVHQKVDLYILIRKIIDPRYDAARGYCDDNRQEIPSGR